MDEFFERLKEQAYKAKDEAAKLGKQVYAKTNNVISQTKLSFAINETDSKIKDVYSEMGKKLYEAYLISGNCIDELKEECEQLDALIKEKEALREKMSELKESVKCPECGKYNKSDASYCSKCGAKLSDSDDEYAQKQSEEAYDGEEEDAVTETVKEAARNAKEAVKEAAESAKDAVKDAEEDIKDAAHYAKEEIEDAAEDVKKSVKKVITIKAKKPSDNQ